MSDNLEDPNNRFQRADAEDLKESSDGAGEEEEEEEQVPLAAIPSFTQDWFRFDAIHPIEEDSLPEFFSGQFPSKTP